jgi:hypothetical protein
MYYSYVEIEYVATSFSPARMDLALKLLIPAENPNSSKFNGTEGVSSPFFLHKRTRDCLGPPAPRGGGDTPEIKEFCCRRPGYNVYVDKAVRHGSTDAQGQRQDGSLVDYDDDDDGGDDDDDNDSGRRGDARRRWGRVRVPPRKGLGGI